MKINNKEVERLLSEQDKQVLRSALLIANNVMLRNNLDIRAVMSDASGAVAIDTADDYEDLAKCHAFVQIRR